MARAATFNLVAELAKRGFTPAARDAPALVDLLVAGEEPAATRAAPALAGLGEVGRVAIEARLASTDEAAAARLVGVLGLLARAGDADARAAVIAHAGA